MSLQVQEILNEMMRGPDTCYILFVEYADGTNKFFTFSTEEGQVEYVEYLTLNNRTGWIERIVLGESLVDFRDEETWLFYIH